MDAATLRAANLPIGIALRVGPYTSKFAADDDPARLLSDLAMALVSEARAARLPLKELQLDFDCAESKLDGYRVWVETIRRRVAPVPLTITALPCWLRHEEFKTLIATTDGYVLQVHSLERPAGPDAPMTLCDPAAARRYVEKANSLGRPFRVALPTYGYVAGFDSRGKLLGLSAEGPLLTWPAGVRLRELRADPGQLAGLVKTWTSQRPSNLKGVLWYRLPTERDAFNWRWPTLRSVIAGKVPQPRLRAEVRRTEPGIAEIELVNDGDADDSLRVMTSLDCANADVIAADALNGFEFISELPARVIFRGPPRVVRARLAPGERKRIGWLRMKEEKEIKLYVASLAN
jgi:hypothetical protein